MLLDTSALTCALTREDGTDRLTMLLEVATVVAVGSPILLEAGIVLAGRGVDPRVLPGYLDAIGAEVLDFRKEHQAAAIGAFLRFGKGRHPARLNFGDCLSYACAAVTGLPLVYKGEDFGLTDLKRLHRLDDSPTAPPSQPSPPIPHTP